jgi:hypothetical protein
MTTPLAAVTNPTNKSAAGSVGSKSGWLWGPITTTSHEKRAC